MQLKVVVRYRDGRVIKGTTMDFAPEREKFHIILQGNTIQKQLQVLMSEIKGVFFVKDFAGNPGYKDEKRWSLATKPMGRPIVVDFEDGEELWGYTQTYRPGKKGYFVVPCDPNSNNQRVYVVSEAVTNVKLPDPTNPEAATAEHRAGAAQ